MNVKLGDVGQQICDQISQALVCINKTIPTYYVQAVSSSTIHVVRVEDQVSYQVWQAFDQSLDQLLGPEQIAFPLIGWKAYPDANYSTEREELIGKLYSVL